MPIPYGKQFIDQSDIRQVSKSLRNRLITTGKFVLDLEKKVQNFLSCKYAVTCSSGTAALHLAMLSLGLKKNQIVLMPAINFIASYNIAKNMGAKIFLVDVDEYTGQITPDKILQCIKKNKLKNIQVLITMYQGGYPENIEEFYKLKKKYKFAIIEDGCHAFGAEYMIKKKFIKVGSCRHSDICTFSMHPVKTITSGEGGIVTTNNKGLARKIKLYRSHGLVRNLKEYWKYDILKTGYNYRLSDINCALGLTQLKKINFFLKKRESICQRYIKELTNINPNLKLPRYSKFIKSANHLFLININFTKMKKKKDDFFNYLKKNKILAQFHYIPIYKFSVYKENQIKFNGAEKYFKNSISIPIFVGLKIKEQTKIIKIIRKFFN